MSEAIRADNRKDLLLLVLAAANEQPVVGVTRLQKYLFLLQEHTSLGAALRARYDFRPDNFGPFDDQLYADLDFLENLGLITKDPQGEEPSAEEGEQRAASESWSTNDPEFAPWTEDETFWAYRLTPEGRDFVQRLELDEGERSTIEQLKERWNSRPLAEFLRWLYAEYPETAVNTQLTHLRSV